MTRKTTRDAALSRLFGAADEEPDSAAVIDDQADAREGDTAAPQEESRRKSPRRPSRAQKEPTIDSETERPLASPVELAPEVKPGASGYIGLGRYVREGGVLERITPYVRPDQAEALRVAVARKRDPRGRDISQIIQTLLDEAGYREPGAAHSDEPS